MPDQEQTAGFSRACPGCGRRVPRNVATCRCGAALPADTAAAPALTAEKPEASRSPVLATLIVLGIVLAGAGYWIFKPAASPPARTAEAGESTDAPEPGPGDGAPRSSSPEARAWDAAANAKDAPKTPDPAVTPANAAAPPAPSAAPGSIEEMVDRVLPAVVLIETTTGRGSGFFVRNDTLITNVHVVQNDGYVTLRKSDGSTVNARVESRAPAFDIAVLKVAQPSASQVVIPMGTAQALKPGQEIVVIGSALGTLENSVSRGIVSGLRTSGGATLVQTDAATNPGNSGGPMLDRYGSVIGITTMGYRGAEGLNFGVAIDHARDLLEGRQANLGTQSGLGNIQSLTRGSGASESDRLQQQGQEEMKGHVKQLADAAGTIDTGWTRFRKECYASPIPGSYDREWFVMMVPRGLPGNAGAGCASFFAAMDSDVKQFKGLMQKTISNARRANVLPGTIRDVLRSNRLDFEWER
jgi:S1-C subfamily serine protease